MLQPTAPQTYYSDPQMQYRPASSDTWGSAAYPDRRDDRNGYDGSF
jgi:hypothetical protein